MNIKLFWKSVIRRKGSLLLLLALIITASFGFVLRAVEYLAVSREIGRIEEEYQPIGSLTKENWEIIDGIPDWDVTEGVSLVEESTYVESVDINRHCPAILSDIYNADLDGWEDGGLFGIKISQMMVWGEVTKVLKENPRMKRFEFQIKEGVYGYPEYIEPGKVIRLAIQVPVDQDPESFNMEKGKTYLIKGCPSLDNMGNYGHWMLVSPLPLKDSLGGTTLFLEGEPDLETAQQYLDGDEELQERNRHAVKLITTSDMSKLPKAQEVSRDLYLEDGRWLSALDQEEGHKVCAITKEFADVRGLSVGDSLTMTIQNRMTYFYGYANKEDDTWEDGEKTEVTLEIVGVYGRLYGGEADGYSSVDSTIIYVPDSCVPEHYVKGDSVEMGNFSFVLSDPKEKEAFLQEMAPKMEPLGITIKFVENSWDSFYKSAKAIEQGAFYSFLVFAVVMVVAVGAVAFLYTWQRRKETAIARALGVPAKKAAACACVPMLALGVAGIFLGGALAWNYGLGQAEENLASLGEGSRVELPAVWLIGLCLLVWLALLLMLLAGSIHHAQKPVLEILQGKRGGRQKKADVGAARPSGERAESQRQEAFEGQAEPQCQEAFEEQEFHFGRKISGRVLAGFAGRCLRHFSLRTVYALVAAAVFCTASCWLRESIRNGEREVDHLYRSTAVDAEITKKNAMTRLMSDEGAYIGRETIQGLLDTGFIKEQYLVAAVDGRIGKADSRATMAAGLIGIADPGQYLGAAGNRIQIHYGDGYGPELFAEDYAQTDGGGASAEEPVVILPESIWMEMELDPEVQFYIEDRKQRLQAKVVAGGYYTGEPGGLNPLQILVPLSFLEKAEKENLLYLTARFTLDPEKNRELAAFQQESGEIIEAPDAGGLELSFVVWDGELKQAVEPMEKNITLLKILYPIANAAAFLAAIGLSILFLFQRRREAAILRVLGVDVLLARAVLALELLVLDIAGLLLGVGLVALLTGTDGIRAVPLAAGCYFLGCLMGTTAGAAIVTSGRPLELLQEKE